MNLKITQADPTYTEALAATDSISPLVVGFSQPEATPPENFAILIKQNNLLIQLITQQQNEIQEIKEQLAEIKGVFRGKHPEVSETLEKAVKSLSERLEKLPLGEHKQPKKKGPLYVFKDPYEIFLEEKKKLGLK